MVKISIQSKKIDEVMKKVGNEFVCSQKYKDDREWWILCSFVRLYKRDKKIYPKYAEKRSPNDPDFLTFIGFKKEFHPIEVVEVLTPNRRRCKEYRDLKLKPQPVFESVEPIAEPWESMIENINKKFLKNYQKKCWLLVYHNMSYSEISHYGYWHNTVLHNFQDWYSSNIIKYNDCSYECIYIINSKAKALVRTYPDLKVIVPEKRGGFTLVEKEFTT